MEEKKNGFTEIQNRVGKNKVVSNRVLFQQSVTINFISISSIPRIDTA